MDIPSDIAARMALTQQAVALSVMKQSAQADRQVANMLEQSAQNIAASTRGSRLNILA